MGDTSAQLHLGEETHCDICGADFDTHEMLVRHEATIHPGSWS